MKPFFTEKLLEWNKSNARSMPWKGKKDPYLIWLSEIILQQTRVEQGMPYFNKFINNYPTVKALAKAKEDEVMRLWQGLGYYSRARNMHATAKLIADQLGGIFPNKYDDILKLKGVGPYTAAAIASFAFNQPIAVLDGNVFRVLARFFDIQTPSDSTLGKKKFNQLANELIAPSEAAIYNQAIMDFGATICTPNVPLCTTCIMKSKCKALAKNRVNQLPIKLKKIIKKTRYFNYFVMNDGNKFLIEKRTENDIWKGLYQFPMLETKTVADLNALVENKTFPFLKNLELKPFNQSYKQALTHQTIFATFWEISVVKHNNNASKIVTKQSIDKYAFPKIINCYLKDKQYI